MNTTAKGPFTVKMSPVAWTESSTESISDHSLARFLLDKQFQGDLEGTSLGQMLTAGTVEKGSAGYVAIEKVTGTLHGRKGTFILQHSATMNRGNPELSIKVVPDSGTDELTGLAGSMNIIREEGKHAYEFTYTLATIQ